MARRPRIQFYGAIYHTMSRGNRKGRIFEDDRDRKRFLSIVEKATVRYGVECAGYGLMSNHYHLVIHTPRGNVSRFMKQVNGDYTQYVNRRHKWTGHVFEGRFTALIIDDGVYLQNALRYVALNPVEAGLVGKPESWEWSSYGAAIGLRRPEPFLATEWIGRAFPADTVGVSRSLFTEFVAESKTPCLAGNEQIVAGSDRLREAVRAQIAATRYLQWIPRSYRALARPPLDEVFANAVTREERRVAVKRANVVYGYLPSEVARFLGVHPTTISRMLRNKAGAR